MLLPKLKQALAEHRFYITVTAVGWHTPAQKVRLIGVSRDPEGFVSIQLEGSSHNIPKVLTQLEQKDSSDWVDARFHPGHETLETNIAKYHIKGFNPSLIK